MLVWVWWNKRLPISFAAPSAAGNATILLPAAEMGFNIADERRKFQLIWIKLPNADVLIFERDHDIASAPNGKTKIDDLKFKHLSQNGPV